MSPKKRRKLEELSPDEIALLEVHFEDSWPEVWRDIARSCFLTLLSIPEIAESQRVEIALQLTQGYVTDHGGSQPYIPVGYIKSFTDRRDRVLQMLAQGRSYKAVARECCLTEASVRRIEGEQRGQKGSFAQRICTQKAKEKS